MRTPQSWRAPASSRFLVGPIVVDRGLISIKSDSPDSRQRQKTGEPLLELLDPADIPQDLMQVQADPGVARSAGENGTVYARLACPGQDEIWVACVGFPAPAQSSWYRVYWSLHIRPTTDD